MDRVALMVVDVQQGFDHPFAPGQRGNDFQEIVSGEPDLLDLDPEFGRVVDTQEAVASLG